LAITESYFTSLNMLVSFTHPPLTLSDGFVQLTVKLSWFFLVLVLCTN